MKTPWQKLFQLLSAVLAVVGLSRSTLAQPITYLYEGTGTGTLGASRFIDAPFTITALADADDVAFWPEGGNAIQNTHLSAEIAITGIAGSFTILTPSHTWGSNQFQGFSYVGLGEALSANWITVNEQAVFAYDLATPLGPILETNPQDVGQFHDVATTGGLLTFSTINEVTFTAIIPEPASAGLASIALVALACRVLNRREALHVALQ